MDPDDAGAEEGLGVEDAPIDVRLGRHVDHRVGGGDQGGDNGCVGDVAADEREPPRLLGLSLHHREVGPVPSVGQLVEDRDARAVAAAEDPPDELGADEPRAAGDQQVRARADCPSSRAAARHAGSRGRSTGLDSRPAASSACASSAALSRDGTVPASAHCPS